MYLLLEGTAVMRLQEEPRGGCVLACLCHTEQTQSFDHVCDMELDCKLNFVGTKSMSGHMRKQEIEWEKNREKNKGGRMSDLCLHDYL